MLERESRIYATYDQSGDSNPFAQQSARVRDSMWRIRHVLSERQTAWENGLAEFAAEQEAIIARFEEDYLEADDSQDAEMEARLERFQLAFYGIGNSLEPADVNENVVRGIKKVAQLKFLRFQSTLKEQSQTAIEGPRDIKEAYLLFLASHSPEGVQEAVDSIVEQRNSTEAIPEAKDQETLVTLLEQYNHLEDEQQQQ